MTSARGRTAYYKGLLAEDAAIRHYEDSGASVLGRRVRTPAGEIDLILAEGETVVFVEVKARRGFGAAAASLSPRQIARIGQAAEIWLAEAGRATADIRFDVVLADRDGRVEVIRAALDFSA